LYLLKPEDRGIRSIAHIPRKKVLNTDKEIIKVCGLELASSRPLSQ